MNIRFRNGLGIPSESLRTQISQGSLRRLLHHFAKLTRKNKVLSYRHLDGFDEMNSPLLRSPHLLTFFGSNFPKEIRAGQEFLQIFGGNGDLAFAAFHKLAGSFAAPAADLPYHRPQSSFAGLPFYYISAD